MLNSRIRAIRTDIDMLQAKVRYHRKAINIIEQEIVNLKLCLENEREKYKKK